MSNVDLGTATGKIVIDSSSAVSGINQFGTALNTLNTVVTRNWWGLTNVGVALGGISALAVGAFSSAAGAAVDWQNVLAKLGATMYGASAATAQNQQTINQLSQGLQNLGANSVVPIEQIGNIANAVASLGVRANDLVPLTQVLSELSTVAAGSSTQLEKSLARLVATLSLTPQEVQQLGSAVFALHSQTPATAQSTLDLTQKLVGLTATAGLTIPQVLAIASAVATVTPNSQRAAVTITTVFKDMLDAADGTGKGLQLWADTAGKSVAAFASEAKTNAAGAFDDFVTGLSRLYQSGVNIPDLLTQIGIKGQFQQQILSSLATTQHDNAAGAANLSNQLRIAQDAWNGNNLLAAAAEQQYKSTAGQFAEFRNQLTVLEQNLGAAFLPALASVVQVLKGMIDTWNALPGPVRDAVIVMGLVTAGLTAFGAIVFAVGPQIVQTLNSILALSQAMSTLSGNTRLNALSVDALAATEEAETLAAQAETLQKQAQASAFDAVRLAAAAATATHAAASTASNQSTQAAAAEAVALDNLNLKLRQVALQEEAVAEARRVAAEAASGAAAAEEEAIPVKPGIGVESIAGLDGGAAATSEADAIDRLATEQEKLSILQNQAALAEANLQVMRDRNTNAIYQSTEATINAQGIATKASQAQAIADADAAAATDRLVAANNAEAIAAQKRAEADALANSETDATVGIMDRLTSKAGLLTLGMGAAAGGIQGATGQFSGLGSTLTGVGALMTFLAPETFGLAGVLGILTSGVGLGITAFQSFSGAANSAKQSINDVASADQELTSILEQTTGAIAAQANQWLINKLVTSGAFDEMQSLGIGINDVLGIIKGTVSQTVFDDIIGKIKNAADSGNEGAKNLGTVIQQLTTTYSQSSQAANDYSSATQQAGATSSATADQVNTLNDALTTQQKTMDAVATAGLGLIDAENSLAKSQDSLQTSEDNLKKAQQDVANQWEDIQKAQIDVEKTTIDLAKAQQTLAQDQSAVAEAAAAQAQETADAAQKVADANLAQTQAAQRLTDAQDALRKAQGPDAANALADANNRLLDSELALQKGAQDVADAQWQLQYLQNEGASRRDVANAQLTLNEAIQKQADSQQKVADDTASLADQQVKNQEDLQNAIQAVATAQNDVTKATTDSTNAANAYSKALSDAANNKDYNDAIEKVKEDQLTIQSYQLQQIDNQRKLSEAQGEGPALLDKVRQAQEDVATSVLNVAKAQAEVDKNQWLINNPGGTYTAQQNLDAVLSHLQAINNNFTGPAHAAIQGWINDLSSAKQAIADAANPTAPSTTTPSGGAGTGQTPGNQNTLQNAFPDKMPNKSSLMGDITGFFSWVSGQVTGSVEKWGGLFKGWGEGIWSSMQSVGGAIGSFFSGLSGTISSTAVSVYGDATRLGSQIGSGVWQGLSTAWTTTSNFFTGLPGTITSLAGDVVTPGLHIGSQIIGGISSGISGAVGGVWTFFSSFIGTGIRYIGDIGGNFSRVGGSIIGAIVSGVRDAAGGLWTWMSNLPGEAVRAIGNVSIDLSQVGWNIITAIIGGLTAGGTGLWNWASNLPNAIFNAVGGVGIVNAGTSIFNVGENIVIGIWNGITSKGSWIYGQIVSFVKNFIEHAVTDPLSLWSPSRVMMGHGENIVIGLMNGIATQAPAIQKQMMALAASMQDPFTTPIGVQLALQAGAQAQQSQQAQASVAQSTALGQGVSGDTYHFYQTKATPQEIVNDISWQRRINARR